MGADKRGNTIRLIHPFLLDGATWVFNDSSVGLLQEPFVGEFNKIIDKLVADFEDAAHGFAAYFSDNQFPGASVVFERLELEAGGAWYRLRGSNEKGWLCGALMKYFDAAPKTIYVRLEEHRGSPRV